MSSFSRIRCTGLALMVLLVLQSDVGLSAARQSPADLVHGDLAMADKPKTATVKLLHRSRINAEVLRKLQQTADADKTAAFAGKDYTSNLRLLKLRDLGVDKLSAHALSKKQQLPPAGQLVSRKMVGGPLRSLLPKLHSAALLNQQAALTKESVESPRSSFTPLGSLESLEKLTSQALAVRLAAANKAPRPARQAAICYLKNSHRSPSKRARRHWPKIQFRFPPQRAWRPIRVMKMTPAPSPSNLTSRNLACFPPPETWTSTRSQGSPVTRSTSV